jgi:hypothetical protein
MRLAPRLAPWLAIVPGALLVVGLLAAPAQAGHASTGAAHARRNGVDRARAAATAWKPGEWASDQRLATSCGQVAKGWKGNWGRPRRAAKQCAPASLGSVVRAVPVRRQAAQPTTTTVPSPTAPRMTRPLETTSTSTTGAPNTICEPTTTTSTTRVPTTEPPTTATATTTTTTTTLPTARTPTTEPPTTSPPRTTTSTTSTTSTTRPPATTTTTTVPSPTATTTTICQQTTKAGGEGQLASTGSSPAHLLIAVLVLCGGGLAMLLGARSRAATRGTK